MSKNQFKSISYCRNAADYQIELDTNFIYFRLTSRYIKWIHYHQLTNRANFYCKISSLRPRHHTELNNVVYCTRQYLRLFYQVYNCYTYNARGTFLLFFFVLVYIKRDHSTNFIDSTVLCTCTLLQYCTQKLTNTKGT